MKPQPVAFQSFQAETHILCDDEVIPSLPFWYSFTGQHSLQSPAFASVDAHADEEQILHQLAEFIEQAKSNGNDGLILGTECPTGSLCAINNSFNNRLDFPTILIAQNQLEQAKHSALKATCSATLTKDSATNLFAQFKGPENAPRLVITTPFSGWFHCAGERGTGLALAIRLAKHLSQIASVDLLLATGHEIGFLGGYNFAETYPYEPNAVLHLGSCIANINGELLGICSANDAMFCQIAKPLEPLGISLQRPDNPMDPNCWVGESVCWAPLGLPIVSIAGNSPHFHTADDLTEKATTPELLETAFVSLAQVASTLLINGK